MSENSPPEGIQTYAGTVVVSSGGRVTIPSDTRDKLGVGYGDKVSLIVETQPEDEDMGHIFETKVLEIKSRGQVTIPSKKRDLYDVEEGEKVDIVVETRS